MGMGPKAVLLTLDGRPNPLAPLAQLLSANKSLCMLHCSQAAFSSTAGYHITLSNLQEGSGEAAD